MDATRCPLCGEVNRCAVELERETGEPQGSCWCMQGSIATEVLARIPAEARGLACICARCASGLAPSPSGRGLG
ncbi:cysteine-rich CWC family protein [Variovorax sp. KK3]|uniref:cysteine-rich CWC family protein n=1 Tax=Variovorax sp. KK3 TaxID=1855728 RepID=UPI002741BEA0|nr:cysteine-rich CWC family protein [Variovorax sp. KK3]